MDSPVRKQLKRNDYLRHKMFRKIKRRRKAEQLLAINAPAKELRRRLRRRTFKCGKDAYEDGKDEIMFSEVQQPLYDQYGNLLDPNTGMIGTTALPNIEVIADPDDVARGRAARWYKDFGIESNDATSTPLTTNHHLKQRSEEGAAKAAAWAKDHPYLNTAGLAAGAAPFAVAATPAIVGGGELAATALANPYVDAALTSMGGAHAAQSLANGRADWMTALELAPLGRLARPLYEGVVQPGMRLFNSPLTGNWTKIGNREYRLSPNSLGANGSPIESRGIAPQITAENAASGMPNIVRTVQDNGKIRLSLSSHTENKPRQFVLEPAPEGNNKYYVHMKVWDDPKNKVPGNITDVEKQQLFEALYNELPEGAEILFPKSGPGYYGTRGTVAGLQRLARDSRFTPGTKGTLQYLDKDGKTIRTYEGTSFIKKPRITAENAASITPEQWTAAQDAAIARGDMAEAQRLRDLHFKVKAPKANIPDQYHGTHYDNLGNQIILNKGLEQGTNGVGFYTSSNKPYARKYGPNIFRFKVNARKEDLAPGRFAYLSETRMNDLKAQGYEGTIDTTSGPMLGAGKGATEYTFFNPNSYRLADAVTYDNKGVRIPLGLRDNFRINDIRYGLLPFLGLGMAENLNKPHHASGKDSGIHIKPENRGKFTRLKKRTGKSASWFKAHGTPAQKKMATFALNARKWSK